MDPNRLRELVEEYDAEPHTNPWQKQARDAISLLTCRDPLTLDAAVKVMGREPVNSKGRILAWEKEDIFIAPRPGGQVIDYVVVRRGHWYLPTVGQFACLVLAAKMGEQA
jgi:hypothetical protein